MLLLVHRALAAVRKNVAFLRGDFSDLRDPTCTEFAVGVLAVSHVARLSRAILPMIYENVFSDSWRTKRACGIMSFHALIPLSVFHVS